MKLAHLAFVKSGLLSIVRALVMFT